MQNNTIVRQPASFRGLWSLVLLAGIALLLVIIAIWMLASQYDFRLYRNQSTQGPLGVSQLKFTEETGIQIMRVNVTLGGGALNLRYQVVDPDKAVIIHDDAYPPGFELEATGELFVTPWHEHSHDQELHPGVTYYELIKNNGGAIRPGDKVTILVGTSRLEHVVIQ